MPSPTQPGPAPGEAELRVVGLSGSLRPGSATERALALALRGAQLNGARTDLLNLRAFDLPFMDARDDESTYPAGVFRLRKTVQAAHGIILSTPEYHASYSGVLKNALDLMGWDEFQGKMVGLVAASGGRMGGLNALNALRNVCRSLHAWVVPEQVGVAESHRVFDGGGRLTDPRLEERLVEVGRQVARFAFLHTSSQAQEFLRAWESALPNPGGEDR